MSRFYEAGNGIKPFLVGTFLGEEMAPIFGPRELSNNWTSVRESLRLTRHGQSPAEAQVVSLRQGEIICTATLQSRIRDDRSDRLGLALVIGIIAPSRTYYFHRRVVSKSFELLLRFLEAASGDLKEGEIFPDAIVRTLQSSGADIDSFFEGGLANLLNALHWEFHTAYKERPSLFQSLAFWARTRKFLREARLMSGWTILEVQDYWKYVDFRLSNGFPSLYYRGGHSRFR